MSDAQNSDYQDQIPILKLRLSKGEITKKEYETLKKEFEAARAR